MQPENVRFHGRTPAQESRPPHEFEPRKRSNPWVPVAFMVAVGWIVVLILRVSGPVFEAGPESRLERAVDAVARLIDDGDVSGGERVIETARIEAGCGHVHAYVVPAPRQAPSGGPLGGGGLAQQEDPEKTVVDQVAAESGAEYVVSALAAAGDQVVVLAAWACE